MKIIIDLSVKDQGVFLQILTGKGSEYPFKSQDVLDFKARQVFSHYEALAHVKDVLERHWEQVKKEP